MAPEFNTVSDAEAQASRKAVYEERKKADNPKTIAHYEGLIKKHWQPFCKERKYNPDDLSDNQLAKFAEHLKDGEVTHDTCRGIVTALGWKQRDLAAIREKEAVTWTMRPAETPALRDLAKVTAKRKRDLSQNGGGLAAVVKQRVTDLQCKEFMKLSLKSLWAIPLRLDASMQASTASRVSDVAHMKLSNMAVTTLEDTRPDCAEVLISYSAVGKHLKEGSIEKHSVVRHRDVDYCPVSAAADAVIHDLVRPGRLHPEVIERVHLLRAPNSDGATEVNPGLLREHMKPKMLEAGVQCDAVAFEGANPKVTHLWKYRAVATMLARGIPFKDVSMEAGHHRDVTHSAYLKHSDPAVMLAMAGFWQNGARSYWLGRGRVEPPSSLLALALPGLDELLAANPVLEELRGDLLRHLRKVWLQDAVLKLERLGETWGQHFPHLAAITAHPAWEDFSTRVKEQHQEGLSQAATPAGTADVQALQAQLQHMSENQALDKQALLQQMAHLPTMLAAAVREGQQAPAADERDRLAKQPRTEALPSTVATAAAAPARPQGLVWVLREYYTVAEAYARYLEIKALLRSERRWQSKTHAVAFSEFGYGLAAQMASRDVEALDIERLTFKGHRSQLQMQKSHYFKLYSKKPCARGCPLCKC